MVARSRARYLAPIALILVIAGIYLVADSALSDKTVRQAQGVGRATGPPTPPFYVVRPGENLTGISKHTRVPVAIIESLNPNVDPNSLQAGQRLRLRR